MIGIEQSVTCSFATDNSASPSGLGAVPSPLMFLVARGASSGALFDKPNEN